MKNIHLLPTENPSRLWYNNLSDTDELLLSIVEVETSNNQHIYITSDEEIKDEDYCVHTNQSSIIKICEGEGKLMKGHLYLKKIILTTDQDLIADGVQSIDDEFLEWFVKNPSCEYIKTIRNKKLASKNIFDAKEGDLVFNNHGCGGIIQELSNDIRVHIVSENGEGYMETAITADNGIDTLIINNYKVYEYTDYKIIIPKQEEPKQYPIGGYAPGYYGCTCITCKKEFMGDKRAVQCEPCATEMINTKIVVNESEGYEIEKTKQETLEEAAENFANSKEWLNGGASNWVQFSFKKGADWQAERMYSEKEVIDILYSFHKEENSRVVFSLSGITKWFEQFKKK